MNKVIVAAVAAAMGVVGVSPAFAAEGTLSGVTGKVMVRQGGQFVPARADMTVSDGDIVSVLDKGSAVVAYDGLCSADLKSGMTVVVGPALCAPTKTGQATSTSSLKLILSNPIVVAGIVGLAIAVPVALSSQSHGLSD